MKVRQFFLILIAFLTIGITMGQAQQVDINKLMDTKGITSIFLSQSMLNMVPKSALKKGKVDYSPIINRLKGLYVFTSENQSGKVALNNLIAPLVKDDQYYQLLMTVKDADNQVRLLSRQNNNIYQNLYMLIKENSGYTLIVMKGDFLKKDVQKIISASR